ncbi:Heat-inducible transcription repressor HrcA [Alteripontixanthobacter maritimus]|uniref:Heat-inducible transcription repressor HrcA n=1 Tax=Alteripontixanthobacter maritimus TaxID=2161824 RepID=A0A369Q5D3_9SPHN|nr:heat-inducible transcriptional repressor HrcA [Alteripontixanthobacter maritimus]RDC59934.1 Heat-inducible transcription repressor HrcA [Alteripontixanthobacter maritimus]
MSARSPTNLDVSELSGRARDIFRLVVEGYLDSGHPVGSKALAGEGGVDLSPASIRSVLAELEAGGLLSAPHTSAGRMPTTSGLRLFVDAMMQVAQPNEQERAAIAQRIAAPGPVENALEATSALLSDLSGAAGMVMVPTREPRLSQVNLLPLGETKALAVLVGEDGSVENRVLELAEGGASPSVLEQAGNYITAQLAGRTLQEALSAIRQDIKNGHTALDDASRDLVERGLATWSEDAQKRPVLIVRGQANLLDESALDDLDRVRSLLDDLENKQSVAALMQRAQRAKAARIFIGSENRLFALSGSSVIASPYHDAEGKVIGVLGVIGPTRLNYARLVPMVDFTAQSLGKSLSRMIG